MPRGFCTRKVTNKIGGIDEMEIFFSIIAGIFAIIAAIFGVKRNIRNTRTRTNGRVFNDGSRYNDLVSDNKRLERDKDRVEELDKRDDGNIERCKDISSRIRKREQETTTE